jgi:hypothetical protein
LNHTSPEDPELRLSFMSILSASRYRTHNMGMDTAGSTTDFNGDDGSTQK